MAKKRNNVPAKKGFDLHLLPSAIALGVIPLIVYLKQYKTNLEGFEFFSNTPEWVDFFLYYKAVAFITVSAAMAVILAAYAIKNGGKIKFSKIFLPSFVYAFFVVLSLLTSEYKYFGLHGIYEQFESVWVLLGYVLLTYYTFLFVNDEQDISFLMKVLFASSVIMLLIGASQAFSIDFYRSNIGQHMIAPSIYLQDGGLTFNFELGRVYLSLYNPNYVGSYAALISPIFLMLVFVAKKKWYIPVFGLMYIGTLLALFGSQSRAGFIGILATILLLIIIFNKQIFRYWIPFVIMIAIFFGSLFFINSQNGVLIDRIVNMFNTNETPAPLEAIYTNTEDVRIAYKGNELSVQFNYDPESGDYSFVPMNGRTAELVTAVYDESGSSFTITDAEFEGFKMYAVMVSEEQVGFAVEISGQPWYFYNAGVENGGYYYFNVYGRLDKINNSETFALLKNHGHFASGRGFIWGKTIPQLKKYIFTGSGPDTFILAFPNDDYVGMYNYGYSGQVMTKPHNLYLQIATQTGVISALAFIVFYCWYFFTGLILYLKRKDRGYLEFIGIGLLTGTFGYMVVGIINDSTVALAPMYWTLLGMGIAVNALVKKKAESEKETE